MLKLSSQASRARRVFLACRPQHWTGGGDGESGALHARVKKFVAVMCVCVCYNIGSTIDHGVGNIGYNIGCFFVASGF